MRSFTLGYSSYFPNWYGYAVTTGNTTQQSSPYDKSGRVYGVNYFGSTFVIAISSSTNASPIVLTVASTAGFATLDSVVVGGHLVNTAANNTPSNPTWPLGTVTGTTMALTGSTGNGVGAGTGVVLNTTRFNRSPVLPFRNGPRCGFLPTFGQPNGT